MRVRVCPSASEWVCMCRPGLDCSNQKSLWPEIEKGVRINSSTTRRQWRKRPFLFVQKPLEYDSAVIQGNLLIFISYWEDWAKGNWGQCDMNGPLLVKCKSYGSLNPPLVNLKERRYPIKNPIRMEIPSLTAEEERPSLCLIYSLTAERWLGGSFVLLGTIFFKHRCEETWKQVCLGQIMISSQCGQVSNFLCFSMFSFGLSFLARSPKGWRCEDQTSTNSSGFCMPIWTNKQSIWMVSGSGTVVLEKVLSVKLNTLWWIKCVEKIRNNLFMLHSIRLKDQLSLKCI